MDTMTVVQLSETKSPGGGRLYPVRNIEKAVVVQDYNAHTSAFYKMDKEMDHEDGAVLHTDGDVQHKHLVQQVLQGLPKKYNCWAFIDPLLMLCVLPAHQVTIHRCQPAACC